MYTIHSRDGLDYVNLSVHVEGLREGWQDRMIARYKSITDKDERAGYQYALRGILNEFQPRAYMAAEPVIRFEAQLRDVLAQIEEG